MQKGTVLLVSLLALMAPPAVADEVEYFFALPANSSQMDVIGAVSKERFLRPPAAGDQETVRKYAKQLIKGKVYPAYLASNPVGHVTVEKFDPDSFCAKVKLDFKPTGDCIVSNGKPKRAAKVVEVTPAQRAQAWARAETLFKTEHNVIPKDSKKIFSKVWGRDLDGDGRAEVIAYYFLPGSAPQKGMDDRPSSIRIFGHIEKDKLKVDKIHAEHIDNDDVPSPSKVGPGFYTSMQFDTFDFNGDGRDEIITAKQTMAGTWYYVWGFTGKGWQEVYSTYRYKEEI